MVLEESLKIYLAPKVRNSTSAKDKPAEEAG
jgi:hypothetical protein